MNNTTTTATTEARIDSAIAEANDAAAAAERHLAFARTEQARQHARFAGWSRFFLVTNTNGHIHKAQTALHASTPQTLYGLPSYPARPNPKP
jgi:hypothetical protein